MSNTQQMLRRIDDEITLNRQEIARRQVDIARLEDTRRVLMGLEETDQAAAEARKSAHAGLIPGSSGKPVLIVRKVGSGHDINGHEAPLGIVASGKRKGLPRLKKVRKDKGMKHGKQGSEIGKMRRRILDFLKPGDEPIASADLAANLGLPIGEDHRKPMQNALYHMRVNGLIQRDPQGRYYLPAPQAPPT